jgi:hypothetical protein
VTDLGNGRPANQCTTAHPDEDKVIPWAEGNGLWHTIDKVVSDLAGVDLITFFVQNPYTFDSAESLAIRIGRQADETKDSLQALARAGLVETTDLGDLRVYQMTSDPHRRQTLQQYVSWLREGYHWARMVIKS